MSDDPYKQLKEYLEADGVVDYLHNDGDWYPVSAPAWDDKPTKYRRVKHILERDVKPIIRMMELMVPNYSETAQGILKAFKERYPHI